MSVPEWLGDVPTWIGAGGAIGAAWFAYQTITSQRQQIGEQQTFIAEQMRFMEEQQQNLTLERAELRAAADERRWAQARHVDMRAMKAVGVDTETGLPVTNHWLVVVTNKSDAPIHQVVVRFGDAHLASAVHEWNPARSSPTFEPGERLVAPVHLVGPGRAVRFQSQYWSAEALHNNRPAVFFTDDDGVHWSLDSHGKLEEVPADGAS